jgi:hypothetical protein
LTMEYLDSATAFRNFNLCPHCQLRGDQALLGRLCEGLPMISRSDGTSFHLLLADRPLPYPNEYAAPTRKISVCFWYSHVSEPKMTNATIVTLRSIRNTRPAVFRVIETVADLLAQNLAQRGKLGQFYDFRGDSLFELAS